MRAVQRMNRRVDDDGLEQSENALNGYVEVERGRREGNVRRFCLRLSISSSPRDFARRAIAKAYLMSA